jgi:hypothetical protein
MLASKQERVLQVNYYCNKIDLFLTERKIDRLLSRILEQNIVSYWYQDDANDSVKVPKAESSFSLMLRFG